MGLPAAVDELSGGVVEAVVVSHAVLMAIPADGRLVSPVFFRSQISFSARSRPRCSASR